MSKAKGEALRVRLSAKDEDAVREIAGRDEITVVETLRNLIRSGLDKGYAPVVIRNSHGSLKELAIFMDKVRKLEAIFQQARSKLLVPRPISANDQQAMLEWQADRIKVDGFLKGSAECLREMRVVADLLGAMDSDAVGMLGRLRESYDKLAAKAGSEGNTDIQRRYQVIADWLRKAGV